VIDNSEGLLRGGMFAQGALTLSPSTTPSPCRPRRARGDRPDLRLRDRERRHQAQERESRPADSAGRVQVLEGLSAGDRIVRANLGSLREGVTARLSGPQPTETAKQ
jgi:hypothetical protein